MMDHWFIQDALVLAGFALIFFLLRAGSRNERWQRAGARLRRDRTGLLALGIVLLYLAIGACEMLKLPGGTRSILDLFTAGVSPEKSYSAPLAETLLGSTRHEHLLGRHLLGTDVLGKDVFVQMLKACRTALIIGGMTSAIYVPLGALLGVLAGYFRRWVDDAIQYVYSTLASIPEILLLVAILMVLGKGLGSMSIALGVTGWVGLCRLIRGETMRQTERPYITAARALGQSHGKIVVRHLLPNVMHLVLISAVLGFSNIVLAEAILSYLGVGAPVGTASWGVMIDAGRTELGRDPLVWWNISAATAALFGFVLALNLLGDSLRRAFDPKRA
ncbi:MAG: peptide/nickel transport system permease protein [Chthoniobacter sp.]|jgi:peptide/nickel transport system permease protein|nr:peptide/nickel transport system permease protein [Chthoniobacter sp.]